MRILRGSLTATVLLALAACGGGAPPTGPEERRSSLAVDAELRALLPAEVRDAGVLTVATDPSYPPASAFAEDGRTIVGFEPDLGAALGELLGVEVRFRAEPFDGMLDRLGAGDFDAVMSAMTGTVERQTKADFVDYFSAGTTILAQDGNPAGLGGLADLCGERVAVEEGTVQVDLVARAQEACGSEPVQVLTRPTNDDALLELRTGRVAAVLVDYPTAVYVTTDGPTRAAFELVTEDQYEPGTYGIAVARDRAELRTALTAAMTRLVEVGVYADVLEEWDVASGAVPRITVNGVAG